MDLACSQHIFIELYKVPGTVFELKVQSRIRLSGEREILSGEGEIPSDIPYMQDLKRNDANGLMKQQQTHRLRERTHSCPGQGGGEAELESWG